MKRLAFAAALLAAIALCSPAIAGGFGRSRSRFVHRQQVVVVQQRHRVAFVQPVVIAQPFVQQVVVPHVQAVVVPVHGCQSFFAY